MLEQIKIEFFIDTYLASEHSIEDEKADYFLDKRKIQILLGSCGNLLPLISSTMSDTLEQSVQNAATIVTPEQQKEFVINTENRAKKAFDIMFKDRTKRHSESQIGITTGFIFRMATAYNMFTQEIKHIPSSLESFIRGAVNS